MPAPIVALTRELLHNPATINLERKSAPAVGITQAVYPVSQELKASLLFALLDRGHMKEALVFTRTKHRANRLWEFLEKRGVKVARIHGNRSQAQRTDALEGFKAGRYRVLVATDIAARGIDVEALGHVVNFDVPGVPEDYIHRVGRTARAELTGEAYTFVAPEETDDLRAIERAIGKPLAARHASRLRLQGTADDEARDSAERAHRHHPRPARRGENARESEGRTSDGTTGQAGGTRRTAVVVSAPPATPRRRRAGR